MKHHLQQPLAERARSVYMCSMWSVLTTVFDDFVSSILPALSFTYVKNTVLVSHPLISHVCRIQY